MIIAVDFDGIIVEDKFPEIGEPDMLVVECLKLLQQKGHKLILWTSRVDAKLAEAIDTCNWLGLKFDAINDGEPENLAQYGTNPRKIYADIYIDDHSIWYAKGLLYAWFNEMI
jgi:hypothetical protein